MHIKKLFDLTGRVALVSGGAGKYGRPIAAALGEAGATVVIASRDEDKCKLAAEEMQKDGLKVYGETLNQADEKSVKELNARIQQKIGPVEILVNCAVYRPMKKHYKDDVSKWDESMAANARGLFIMCREFGNAMAKKGGGSIINIASHYGIVAPDMKIYEGTNIFTEPDYPYTKGGMIMYTKYLASYYAKAGVRVNSVSPGGMFWNHTEPFLSNYCAKTLLGRMANSNDIKGAIVLLASDAGAYITGINLVIDGGWTAI